MKVGGFSAVDPLDRVEVFDLQGRLVLHSESAELDLSGLAPGIYPVRIWTRSGEVTRRMVTKL